MPGITAWPTLAALGFIFAGTFCFAQEEAGELEAVISVAEQRMVVLRDGMWVEKYKVSTSKFGIGDSFGSYKTPLGRHRICDKIGDGLPPGAVIKHRNATGEILPANAPGRDPIVTRILWLEGLEQRNTNARSRGIYIHGTVEEDKIGNPVSYGCIRMRSRDVVDAFESLPLGTVVTIQQEKLPHYRRWTPPPTVLLASRSQPKMLGAIAERTAEPSRKTQPEKVEPGKPELKLVSTKPTSRDVNKTSVIESAARKPPIDNNTAAGVTAERYERANAEQDPASLPRVSFGGAAALTALKGSILFSDLPGQAPKTEGLSAGGEPAALEERIASAQLPRVTFRAPLSQLR
jgi:hypothetical protein